MKARIGPHEFPIEEVASSEDDFGSFHIDTGVRVSPGQLPAVAASTVLHEIIHAIWATYHLPKRVTEEEACCKLEGPLLAFIRDNPRLILALRRAAKGKALPL